jgi:hypothetical protein
MAIRVSLYVLEVQTRPSPDYRPDGSCARRAHRVKNSVKNSVSLLKIEEV